VEQSERGRELYEQRKRRRAGDCGAVADVLSPNGETPFFDEPLPPEPPPDETAPPHPGRDPAHIRYPQLNWHDLFTAARDDTDWLIEDLFARGQSYALVSTGKAGKSLLMLDVVAGAASGRSDRSPLGHPPARPFDVLYVDMENTGDDLTERLRDMGYGPDDLARVHYLSFPPLPPLDTPAGGRDLCALAEHYHADLVVLDTISRLVAGEENSADTYQNLYTHTGMPLKAANRTVVRLDHQGYEQARARGSSAKHDDVDAIWHLTASPGADGIWYVQLKLERQRSTAHPGIVPLIRDPTPHLRHLLRPESLFTGNDRVGACTTALQQLRVPADIGARKARIALREAGHKYSNTVIAAAVRERKNAHETRDKCVPEPSAES
jgi:hypothetical protein